MYLGEEIDKWDRETEIFLKGHVTYLNGLPVKNAIIIIEQLINEDRMRFLKYTSANENGDFLLVIKDTSFFYRISAFEGNLNNLF